MRPRPPPSTLCPCTTLFRSRHIRAVADAFAAEGYTAIAPSLFDRVRRGIELDYSPASLQEGAGYAKQLPPELDRKSTRLNSSHITISYAVFCSKKKTSPTRG